MKTLIFTLAFVAVAWGCTEETITCMPISSAQSLEFVPIDQPVYNAEAYPGVYKPCFCQPWVCATPLTVQSPRDPSVSLKLFAYDEHNAQIKTWDLQNLGDDHAFVTIVPEDEPICGKKVTFKIGSTTDVGTPPIFYNDISHQKDYFNGIAWTRPPFSPPQVALAPSGGVPQSDIVYFSVLLFPGTYDLHYKFNQSGTMSIRYTVVGLDGDENVFFSQQLANTNASVVEGTASLFFPEGCNWIGIRVETTGGSGADPTVYFDNEMALEFTGAQGISEFLYHTDCVEFQEAFPDLDLTLIKYWNTKDYDYLHYPSVSPFMSFNLWVPAEFWRNRFPEEDEEHKLSNSKVVALSSEIRRQRLFKTDHLPDWFHQKIMLALKHNRVQINGKMWTKKESYTMTGTENDDNFAFQAATCWLTDAEWLQNNVM